MSSPPGNPPNPGIKPRSPSLQVDSLSSEPLVKPKNTGTGSLSFLQGIFPTQELNWGLLHCRQILCHLSHQGRPCVPLGPSVFLISPASVCLLVWICLHEHRYHVCVCFLPLSSLPPTLSASSWHWMVPLLQADLVLSFAAHPSPSGSPMSPELPQALAPAFFGARNPAVQIFGRLQGIPGQQGGGWAGWLGVSPASGGAAGT